MTTTTNTRYYPKIKGDSSYFSPDGYSKRPYDVNNHIKELREFIYEGKKIYKSSVFEIAIETTVISIIETDS